MRLVIINSSPTSKIFGEKVDAWWYQRHGFEAEFWDISPIFWSQERLKQYYGGSEDFRYIGPNHRIFTSQKDVIKAISTLPQKTIIWHLGWNLNRMNRNDNWLLSRIVEGGFPFFIKQFETDPAWKGIKGLGQRFRSIIARLGFQRGYPTGFIGCGTVARERARHIFPSTSFVSIPTPKVLWEKVESPIESPYVVFVDENVEHAPDAVFLGYRISRDIRGYYRRINRVFSLVEDRFGCPVIIAASGKYRYKENPFEGREIIYGRTLPLIQHARLVIGHCSGALDQAIVDRKPLLQLIDPSFTKVKRKNIHYSARFTGKRPASMESVKEIHRAIEQAACDDHWAADIEAKYFREPGVYGDYREIIRQAFLSV